MRNEDFDITVTVTTDGAAGQHVVSDTVHAAEILLRRWPDDMRGQKYRAALKACMDVMEEPAEVVGAAGFGECPPAGAAGVVEPGVH